MAEANVFAPTDQVHDGNPTPEDRIARYVGQTRPWIGLLTVLLGLATAFVAWVAVMHQVSMWFSGHSAFASKEFDAFGKYLGLYFLLVVVTYAVPTVLLGRYTLAAGATDLHQAAGAVRYHRDFWRAMGMVLPVIIGLNCALVAATWR